MRRPVAVVAAALIVVLVATVPASAATWFQLRYGSANQLWNSLTIRPDTWNSPMFGLSVRGDVLAGYGP
jgi:hypothetical protein